MLSAARNRQWATVSSLLECEAVLGYEGVLIIYGFCQVDSLALDSEEAHEMVISYQLIDWHLPGNTSSTRARVGSNESALLLDGSNVYFDCIELVNMDGYRNQD